MNIVVALYAALLFFILTPNVLLHLPLNGSKMTTAAFHAAVFGILIYLTQSTVWRWSVSSGL
jgi:hypothetical protein